MDDVNWQQGLPSESGNFTFPKIMLTETQGMNGTLEQYSKYDVIGPKASQMAWVKAIQAMNPDVKYHYPISPRAYQGYVKGEACEQGMGIPFGYTGPASEGCTMYAGHWMYMAGTTLVQSVDATAKTIYVNEKDRLTVGQYVVIYDAPAGSFAKAEHAKVVSIDKSSWPYKVTLKARGFKSKASWHPKGAIVAEHVSGFGSHAENWAYNMSQTCPVDANGLTMAEYMANWLVGNYNRDAKGREVSGVEVDGIYFDVDAYFDSDPRWDVDNDLSEEAGMTAHGVNLWGEGLLDFYYRVRERFPNKRIVGGARRSRGFSSLNGVQMEGWPVTSNFESPTPEYEDGDGFDALLQRYTMHMRHHVPGDLYTENLSKTPSKVYPQGHENEASNASFRFGFGSTLLDDGHYGEQNSAEHPDPWYDEYAVDVVPGSVTYGHAILSNPNDEVRSGP